MKVCILGPITTKSYYGGVAVFDEQLALGFYQAGHSVSIVTYQKDVMEEKLFGIITVNKIYSKHTFSRWVKREKPNLIICSLDYPRLIGDKHDSSVKIAYFLHGFFTRSYYGAIKSQLAPVYQKRLIRKVDYVFANSDFTSMVNREFFGIKADKVFRLGVSDDFLKKARGISEEVKKKGTILYVGRLVSAKGVDKLIQAVEVLNAKGVESRLYIAGDGLDKENLAKYAEDRGLKVEFLGKVNHDQIVELYKKAEIFISLNPSEPFGITFAEALLSECKIVCPTTGGQVEFLQKWNKSVAFVNGESVSDIAQGIENLLVKGENPKLNDAEKEIYSYKSVAAQITKFLRDV